MSLHQPVLFVGMGGTGCDVGVELERRLREELCGPDGTALMRDRPTAGLSRYQLPACLQFVYADFNQSALDQLPLRAVPGTENPSAVNATAHYIRDLVPRSRTYPELAANLRMTVEPYVSGWLPPADGEPKLAQLRKGAGQYPTVGRAALFDTLRHGPENLTEELREAIGRLANSGEDLMALGGGLPQAVDVFVAFSVAGGTGAGIFYDFIHLIGSQLLGSGLQAKIYPLVVMPSAFPLGQGGGRPAQLNAGRALLDLFRLVDHQNAGDVDSELGTYETGSANLRGSSENAGVHYPGLPPMALAPSTMQTAFLFSLPAGTDKSDLHRSMVSLVLSLVGTAMTVGGNQDGLHQSFADNFINHGADREVAAQNGIGNRGVSTAQVASLTVPVDELADLLAGRLLSTGLLELESAGGGKSETNRSEIGDFFSRSGIQPAVARQAPPPDEPEPTVGAQNIAIALRDRSQSMTANLADLERRLDSNMTRILEKFDPRAGALGLLEIHDPFRVSRILFGHHSVTVESERHGAKGVMNRLRQTPAAEQDFTPVAPQIPAMKDRLTRRVRYADDIPVAARELQDQWYRWRTLSLWAQAWDSHASRWAGPIEQLEVRWQRFTGAFLDHARQDAELFRRRSEDLTRPRKGVSYFLPMGGNDTGQFYERVINAMIEARAQKQRVRPAASQADLLCSIIDAPRWRQAYQLAADGQTAQAIAYVREYVKEEIRQFLQSPGDNGALPLLPPLALRLRSAAGVAEGDVAGGDVQDFHFKLAGLVPAGFAPQGAGPLKVLVSYPADAYNPKIESYLWESLNLPSGPGVDTEWRPIGAEGLSVVMFRYGMGVTEVDEVREVLRVWARALEDERVTDFLKWRQRTGYDFGYLATREVHRVAILHHLLCALWNGRVTVAEGDNRESPRTVSVSMGGGISMPLAVSGLDTASSWANVIRAYESGALLDDSELRRNFCSRLMSEVPAGISNELTPPNPLYLQVCDTAPAQIALLDEMMVALPPAARARAERMRQFWTVTLPAARRYSFRRGDAIRDNLEELEAEFRRRTSGGQ